MLIPKVGMAGIQFIVQFLVDFYLALLGHFWLRCRLPKIRGYEFEAKVSASLPRDEVLASI